MNLSAEAEALLSDLRNRQASGESFGSLRRELFGKTGTFTGLLQQIASLPAGERPKEQVALGAVRSKLEQLLADPKAIRASGQAADVSIPAKLPTAGTIHPISLMIERMVDTFARLSFEVVEGPEIVGELENFDHLNIGPDHPARDAHDSFYLDSKHLLRTHTTAVQIIELKRRCKTNQLPMRIVVPGKTYRRESDATHSPMFHQFDAVMVDSETTFADLRGCLEYLVRELFGNDVETRFRPHYFPFTEPSAEIDIRWKGSDGTDGKHTEWLEMGGCGMIHPNVLKQAGINPHSYRGWAFGMGVERPVMVKYGVPDLRPIYENGLGTLTQFASI